MAQVSVGKLLPNLKVTLGNDTPEVVDTPEEKDYENSENHPKSSLNNSNVEIVRSWMESLQNPKVYKNKSGGFTTGLDLISEENTELLGKRAERFGLEESSQLAPNIRSLYESMGIDINNRNSAKMKNVRLDALHMRGVNELNTNEIFHYFRDYGPASVEWINDISCNVVWLDEVSCARALLGVSKEREKTSEESPAVAEEEVVHSSDSEESVESDQELKETVEKPSPNESEVPMEVSEDSQQKSQQPPLEIPVPPGHWRLGTPHPKTKSILLRFATKDDRKLPGAEKRSDYYKKYGNPNYGGLVGLISGSRKRKMQAASNRRAITLPPEDKDLPLEDEAVDADVPVARVSHPKPPRMRMYADDEEIKMKKKLSLHRPFKSGGKAMSVHSRLGGKYTRNDLCRLGSHIRTTLTDDEHDVSSRRRKWSTSDEHDGSLRRKWSASDERDGSLRRKWSASDEHDGSLRRKWSALDEHDSSLRKKWSTSDDLRTKLRKIRREHRSALCRDSDSSSND